MEPKAAYFETVANALRKHGAPELAASILGDMKGAQENEETVSTEVNFEKEK